MKKYRSKIFKFYSDLDKSYRQLFGPSNTAGCSVCCEDNPDLLDIHPHDGTENEWRILCDKCYGITKQSFDNGLQKQIGGVNV